MQTLIDIQSMMLLTKGNWKQYMISPKTGKIEKHFCSVTFDVIVFRIGRAFYGFRIILNVEDHRDDTSK